MESNYPDWCTGREKHRAIDGVEDEALLAVMQEDVEDEISGLEERLEILRELLGQIRSERRSAG